MASRMHPQAKRLLDAHVDYVMSQLHGPTLTALLEREVDELFADASRLTLDEAVTPAMIKATALSYAVEIELSGAIPELVGDIARTLYAHPVHGNTTLNDLLPDGLFEEFLDKVLEMRDLHEWIVHEAVANPVYSALATDIVVEGIRGYLHHGGSRMRSLPGMRQASALGSGLLRNALPAIEETLEESLRAYLQKSLRDLLQGSEDFLLGLFDREQVRTLAIDAWDIVKDKRIADFQEGVSSLDIEELFVIGYEAWRYVRGTPLYTSMIEAGIDAFFDKYGASTLREIIDEMGVSREIALREANRFAPHVLGALHKKQLLEPLVRRHLAGFYASAAVTAIVGDAPAAAPARAKPATAVGAKAKAASTATKAPKAATTAAGSDSKPPRKAPKPAAPAKP